MSEPGSTRGITIACGAGAGSGKSAQFKVTTIAECRPYRESTHANRCIGHGA